MFVTASLGFIFNVQLVLRYSKFQQFFAYKQIISLQQRVGGTEKVSHRWKKSREHGGKPCVTEDP